MPYRGKRINYALAATLLSQGLSLAQAAEKSGAISAGSLKSGLARRGITALACKRGELAVQRAERVAAKVVATASEGLKLALAEDLLDTTERLRKIKPGNTLKRLRMRADVLEPLARTGKIVHGWSDDRPSPLVSLQVLGSVTIGGRGVPSIEASTPGDSPTHAQALLTPDQTPEPPAPPAPESNAS
jgi:hypothetical protein